MTIAEEPLTIYKKLTLEGEATLGGLMNLLMRVPASIPAEAEVEDATTFYLCEDHAESEAHEPHERLALTLSWESEEQP